MLLLRALSRVTPIAAVDQDGLRVFVSTADRMISPWTFALGPFSSKVTARALEVLEARGHHIAGRTVLEIGANIGTETITFVRHHGASRVIAIEAAPDNVELLRHNLLANDLVDTVEVHALAASDRDGSIPFALSPDNCGDHRVGRTEGREVIHVPARTLDSLGLPLGEIALVWMDVQGHEAHVLAGATALLAAGVPIVCEYWPYGLREAGGLERFDELVAGREMLDLAAEPPRRITSPAELELDVGEFAAMTDLLLLP